MHGILKTRFANRWLWLCPLLSIVLATAVLVLFGVTFWTALVVALLLVCPALILWGIVEVVNDTRRQRPADSKKTNDDSNSDDGR